ncbi:bifunctional metallophosphatase/5'-nucleotidase [Romboutsia weinsteinii]|uniref:Bifunctional metallophosphatase/5'-nucleotidase n=1 Tax=Romboutsia weinsteinii TaxID=2020949 RepID=A0A371IYV9_9FIRM|nr:bifunctional UDP-sugar hydrolase/5'-nucleotidase [Romboutsia weinsteinii]RDY25646.1 bifunctional metallophosphatase/5'-nucleotidase [Romboutsia weinsteinii]
MKNLKIYFTSDLHGYIYPTDYIDKIEKNIGLLNIINSFEKDENTLIIDGGDTIQGSPFTNYLSNAEFDVHPMSKVMNTGGYDYITLGNHDFNYGYDYLKKYLTNLDAKCLCSNVVDNTGQLPILPFDIKTLGNGLKIGIIGFTTDFINRWERSENINNFTISDTFSSIKPYFDKIKDECDVLIGIYHGGFEYDLESHTQLSTTHENIAYKISKEFNFDILLTGHQHMEIGGEYLHDTYIAQTPHNGSKFLELNLEIDDNNNRNITSSLKNVVLNPNKEMYDDLLPLETKVQEWLDTPVGFLDSDLHPSSHLDMALNGSNLANFINQIELEQSGADVACTSFANSIKGFDKNVTVRDIMSTYMYPNTLVMLEVDRNILKMALERCASYFTNNNGELSISDLFLKPKVEHYNYDYFANINYTFDLNKEVGSRVTSIMFDNKELDNDTKLTLVMNNYRASGAGGYEFYCDCKIVREIMVEMPEVIIDYFRNNKNVVVDKSKYLTVIY